MPTRTKAIIEAELAEAQHALREAEERTAAAAEAAELARAECERLQADADALRVECARRKEAFDTEKERWRADVQRLVKDANGARNLLEKLDEAYKEIVVEHERERLRLQQDLLSTQGALMDETHRRSVAERRAGAGTRVLNAAVAWRDLYVALQGQGRWPDPAARDLALAVEAWEKAGTDGE